MPKVSVIIPVYNSENYLKDAVQTVRNQTLKDIEIILINDQSTDNSGKICDSLKEQDSRIHVIHLEQNKGICGARNAGLQIAAGEYIAFCDNDDYFEPDLIEVNYETAKKKNAEMVKFGRKLVDVDSKGIILREKESPIDKAYFFEGKENLLSQFFHIKAMGVLTNVWNGLYKRSTIKEHNIWFDEAMRFGSEDADFSFRFYNITNNIAINPKSYYIHYRRDAFSTSRKFNMNKIESMIKAAKSESVIWNQLNDTLENRIQTVIAKNNHVINVAMYQIFHTDSSLTYNEKVSILKKMRQTTHLNYGYDREISQQIRKKKPKQWFFTVFYSKKQYHILYWMLLLENKFLGEKW